MASFIEMNRHVQAPVKTTWDAFVDPAQVGTWFAARANVVPERGGAYDLFWQPNDPEHQSTIGCRITAIAQGRYLPSRGGGQTS
jgi:uncharacterized protein YndB with AHSA1/START domain